MKTLILSFLFIIGLSAPNIGKPINDIYSVKEPIFTDEAYVDDIPFDTYEIAVDAILDGDDLKLEEEAYVNDIPFDTRTIASKCLLHKMVESSDEMNVNDIPFDTEMILYELLTARLTEQYRNEKSISDLPDGTDYIICSYVNGVPSWVAVKVKSPRKAPFRQRKIDNFDYTIIYPVKLDLPKIEINNEAQNHEVLVVPGFSL